MTNRRIILAVFIALTTICTQGRGDDSWFDQLNQARQSHKGRGQGRGKDSPRARAEGLPGKSWTIWRMISGCSSSEHALTIIGELRKLGIRKVSRQTVRNVLT
jgi:hypothetical protein